MVQKFKLKLEERQATKPNALRRAGKIPGTLYGPGEASVNVQVDTREFTKLPAAAYSHIVELEGGKGSVSALIRHVQREHTSRQIMNIEFYRVAADRKLTVTVPLKYVGASPAVQAGGVLHINFDECEVECLPADIPDNIEVDLGAILEIDTGIHFSDLKLPKGVEVLNPPEEVVCRVVTRKEEKEEAPAAAVEGAPAAEGAAPAEGAAAAAPAAEEKKEKKK